MRRALLLTGLLLLAAPAAHAQALPETLLHIAETAEVTRAPDELVATLRAEARAGSAAAAQEAVNRSIAAAVARARSVPGLAVATGAYWTGRVDEGRGWQAAQTLTLRGGDAASLLETVGALQSQGLATAGLAWGLTRDTARMAREEASRLALEAVQRRAQAVAAQLGLAVAGLREVRIDVPEREARPMAMAMARGAAAAPPVAVAEDQVVAAGVQAVVLLRPR